MGKSKEQYIAWRESLNEDDVLHYAQNMYNDELWQEYFLYMADKYFPDGCNICGRKGAIILTDSRIIYGKSYGMIYLCTNCRSYVGVHNVAKNQHGEKDAPKGILADAKLRELRKQAHALFDPVWKKSNLSRKGAYMMLKRVLDVPIEQAHIAMLSKEKLTELIEYLKTFKVNNDEKSS